MIGSAPVWGDEAFTLTTSLAPLPDALAALVRDIHPPLYYLLEHYWLKVPAPFSVADQARLLSPVFALLTTWMLYRFWLRDKERGFQIWFLALWTVSPFLLLYVRMARSYTLQMLLVVASATAGRALVEDSRSLRKWAAFVALLIALVYTHYLPGIVFLFCALLWVLAYRRDLIWKLAAACTVIVASYVPWLAAVTVALRNWGAKDTYSVTGGSISEHGVRLAYLFVSWTFGEMLSWWQIVVAATVGLLAAWLVISSFRSFPHRWIILVGSVAAYIGASRWVIYSYAPSRLMFLYPLFLWMMVSALNRRRRVATVIFSVLILSSVLSAVWYFRRENYLNKGLLLPFEEIVAMARQRSPNPVFAMETFNTEPRALLWAARGDRVELIRGRADFAKLDRLAVGDLWYIRNTHDLSPALTATAAEDSLRRNRRIEDYYFVPYSRWERAIMARLQWPGPPSHVLKVMHVNAR